MNTLLDTNVVSELLRARPQPAVLAWFAQQDAASLMVSAVTQAEMMLGARLLPEGRRRALLERTLQAMFEEDFEGRVLAFDTAVVSHYVEIVAERRAGGRPIGQFDAQIAATAKAAGLQLATRNTRDFEGCGVPVVNPWEHSP